MITFRCCRSWRNVVDDGIEGQSLGEAEVEGSTSCEAFVRRNNESEGYDDPGGHRFVVHDLYRRCTVLNWRWHSTCWSRSEILKASRGARRHGEKYAVEKRWPTVTRLMLRRAFDLIWLEQLVHARASWSTIVRGSWSIKGMCKLIDHVHALLWLHVHVHVRARHACMQQAAKQASGPWGSRARLRKVSIARGQTSDVLGWCDTARRKRDLFSEPTVLLF